MFFEDEKGKASNEYRGVGQGSWASRTGELGHINV